MKNLTSQTLNIWQARNRITVGYLKPSVVIKPGELLFLIDTRDRVLVFKTENDVTVMLPTSSTSVVKIF